MTPPDDALDIGDGHKIVVNEYQGETAGVVEYHRKADGDWCSGWVAFAGSKWAAHFQEKIISWQVISRDPLTLSPSILCRACGNHGFIENGKWKSA